MKLIKIIIYAACKVQQLIAELVGYWFTILVCLAVSGLGVTKTGLVWVAVLAGALAALNRTLARLAEIKEDNHET